MSAFVSVAVTLWLLNWGAEKRLHTLHIWQKKDCLLYTSAVHFHSLRHTNASLLIAAHVPVTTVSGRLGHAKTSTTTDIYAGFIRSSDAAAADALTDVFGRIKEKTHA